MNYFPQTIAELFKRTPGAMSVQEGVALQNLMGIIPEGRTVEAGSHMGKSAIAIAWGLSSGPERTLHMIDPLFEDEELSERVSQTVESVSPKIVANLWDTTSLQAFPQIAVYPKLGAQAEANFAFAFLDSGDHSYELVRSEFDFLKDKMVPGGIIALHDYKCYSGPTQLYREAQEEGFEDVNIPWQEIKDLVRREAPDDERLSDSWHKREDPEPCYLAALRKR